jgi:AraC family transcriptional regulator, regulatory protein of adaptative response / DNA-3-methyladenine glycosylase II
MSLKDRSASRAAAKGEPDATVRLAYKPPYDWPFMLEFLRERAIGGIEVVKEGSYSRTFFDAGEQGIVKVSRDPGRNSLLVALQSASTRALLAIAQRVRRVFDLDADLETISNHLAKDPLLSPLLTARPGLRVTGGWDGFELAIRAILGQQITVTAARQLASALVELCGQPIPQSAQTVAGLNRTFPTPERVLAADLSLLGMPASRKRALLSLAEAARCDPFLFQPLDTIENTVMRLRQIRGIGEWTAHYIALRGLRQADAFPASDVGLLRAIAKLSGVMGPTPDHLISFAEPWRPWRAYAAQHLWAVNKPTIANEATL